MRKFRHPDGRTAEAAISSTRLFGRRHAFANIFRPGEKFRYEHLFEANLDNLTAHLVYVGFVEVT